MCIVSTASVANSEEAIAFADICSDPIALSATFAPVTASPAIKPVVMLPVAILAVVTCPVPMCIVSILPETSSLESTALAAIAAPSTVICYCCYG